VKGRPVPPGYRIQSVYASKIFGYLSYYLNFDESSKQKQNIDILYGDNASGKTTLIKIIFHALSPSNYNGHRTFLHKTDFEFIMIQMIDEQGKHGITFTLTRKGVSNEGQRGYQILVRDKSGNMLLNYKSGDSDLITKDDLTNADQYALLILSMNTAVYYLSTERLFLSDYFFSVPSPELKELEKNTILNKEKAKVEYKKDSDVETILSMTYTWLSSRTLWKERASYPREQDDISVQILRSLLNETDLPEEKLEDNSGSIINSVRALGARMKQMGFDNEIPDSINKLRLIESILTEKSKEYVSSHYKEISLLYKIIASDIKPLDMFLEASAQLSESVNKFLTDKSLKVSSGGFYLYHERLHKPISGSDLSSGERQILLLICYTLVTGSRKSILLIDEPELSLNIKWQRKLIEQLDNLNPDSGNQKIIATHSIEILAKYMNQVRKLEDISAHEERN
jgi:energy-coupling factor transporter ATP-binding protein EcfA2